MDENYLEAKKERQRVKLETKKRLKERKAIIENDKNELAKRLQEETDIDAELSDISDPVSSIGSGDEYIEEHEMDWNVYPKNFKSQLA